METAEIEAIVEGRHRDAFGVLGPHQTGELCEIRAWLPHASQAFCLTSNEATPMERVHPAGFFVATFNHRPASYRIRIQLDSGESLDFEDPYRFPPLLTSFELYLHGEGTNYESYRTLGAQVALCEGVQGVRFGVSAPNAALVSVAGDFNDWDRTRRPMRLREGGV